MSKAVFRFIAVLVLLTLQACGIPDMTTRTADVHLPNQFKTEPTEKSNSATVRWNDFFEDENLLSLLEIAVANNKEINIMMQRISAAENEIQARRGAYLPFIRTGAAAGGEKPGDYTFNGAVERNLPLAGNPFPTFVGDYQFGLTSTWEIDIWRKLRNATEVAMLEYMATMEGKNFLITNLIAEVARSYYELVTLDNQLENLDQNIAIQQNALRIVKELQKFARADALAIKRYEAEVAKNQSKRYEIKQQIVVVENRINYLLGRTPQPIKRTSSGFLDLEPKLINTGIPSQLLLNRPDIRKAELELAAAQLNIEVARAEFFPSFGIRAGVGFDAFAMKYLINTPESLAAYVAGELVAPLVNKNAIIANFKTANVKQVQSAFEYEKSIINAYVEVLNQISNIENMRKSFNLKKNQVDHLVKSIDISIQLFKSARTFYLDVLTTQRDALEAKRELIETKQKQMFAMVDLYKSLGGGWR
ncbi:MULTISPECIES: TolC family protein [Methylococcus]|uniref:TolC family protein n=1 Tax=Methylococcus capsulatus TaxID=414 RepID=A0ABZ2F6D4_METCP|nr:MULTISPECIES: TolC family protein [Methylococcus]MDF9392294.1 TolC family protein [Methylococcus capsulatus]